MNDLLIIYYHEVVGKKEGYSYQKIEKEKFEEQMKYLSDKNYHTLFFSELEQDLPERSIIVSFDDGFRTVYDNAAPIMRKYGIRGNIYLPTKYIDCNGHFMTWRMIEELYQNGEFEMQAHTHSHVDIRTLSEEAMGKEIEESDNIMDLHLGYMPKAFCMPYGVYDRSSIRILMGLGRYKYLLGSCYGSVPQKKLETQILPRIGISNDDSMAVFENKLEGRLNWKGSLQRVRLCYKNFRKDRIMEYKF